ncbi:hypothetical protein ILUMI_07601 [Ignelater luminosus]|uniref:YqaJ viral recombinase domain-containing protein n=1 Tax=Ignelater luminosus TaxID=2038154 RepID=A0A8K0GHV8_IGNLU|nr:hypothetical protein ILUMI_07601 [Ignelater luminosus]
MSISQLTLQQNNSAVWFEERRKRITASSFGKVCKIKRTTNPKNTIKYLINGFNSIKATNYGIDNEPIARKDFESRSGLEVEECGFFIDYEDCYIGATPDGLIGSNGKIEIKCARFSTVKEAI